MNQKSALNWTLQTWTVTKILYLYVNPWLRPIKCNFISQTLLEYAKNADSTFYVMLSNDDDVQFLGITTRQLSNKLTIKLWPDPSTRHQSPLRLPGVRRVLHIFSHCHHLIMKYSLTAISILGKGYSRLTLRLNNKIQISSIFYKNTITFLK